MELFDAIHTRHSIGKVKPDPIPRDVIEKLLAAGAQAPNHYKVRPWRFLVMTGGGRAKLGDALASMLKSKQPDLPADVLEKEKLKAHRAPLIIAVAVDQPVESKVIEIENVAAASAACQNILLAAHALGLGAIWRTGDAARDPQVKQALGFDPHQHLIGFLYIGYPEAEAAQVDRPGFEDHTVWAE
jgi:nitroreductase